MWAWAAKEYLNEIYDTAVNRAHAHRMLLWWYWFVAEHPITELVKLASTISTWEPEFLAYFDNRCTNGLVEGKIRIIKHVKHVSANRCSLVSLWRVWIHERSQLP
jgi:transposase